MWIERIDLDDFGHFDRAGLRDLDPGLTVVAGPQRAGKTTFMEAVRHLGYGLTTGAAVPPPTDRYDVAATVVRDGHRYELSLDGFADPAATPLEADAPDRTPRELFGGLRETQYQQLYTVSLDELDRDPDGLDDEVDLSSVLLEAASGGDATDVPDLRDEFAEAARKIGGKHGRKSYELSDPLETIEAGTEEREAALEQVETHESVAEERRDVQRRIAEIDAALRASEAERTRLEAVASGHDAYRAFRDADRELAAASVDGVDGFPIEHLDEATALAADYDDARDARRTAVGEFESAVADEDPDAYRRRLLEAREAIERLARERSGWERRAETLRDRRDELDRRRRDLRRRAAALGPDWDGDPLDAVRRLDADAFSRDAVARAAERYRGAESDVADLSRTADELRDRRDDLEDRIEDAVASSDGVSLRDAGPVVAAGAAGALVAGGSLAVLVDPIVGVVLSTLLCLVAGAYAVGRIEPDPPAHEGVSVETLRAEAEKVRSELATTTDRLAERRADLTAAESTLGEVRERYGLPGDLSADGVEAFHADLVDLRDDLGTHETERERLDADVAAFREAIGDAAGTLAAVGALETTVEDPLADASDCLAAIDRAATHLDHAAAVEERRRRVEAVEASVVDVLRRWERTASVEVGDDDLRQRLDEFVDRGRRVRDVLSLRERRDDARRRLLNHLRVSAYREAFARRRAGSRPDRPDGEERSDRESEDESADGRDDESVDGREDESADGWLIDAYEAVLGEHGGVDAARERREELDDEIEALEAERADRVDERADLDRELEALASDDDVRAAHETIERGRRELEPLAEAYATDRIAEYLLDELHERFLERTTGPLLSEAGDVFRRITGDAYTDVDARDAFDDLDFAAALADGSVHRTAELSRATAEQLFLAVRLARIRRYEEPLPVLLDDSLTNFDPSHARRTLDVIGELADETQVFLLTCHPTVVERVAETRDARYWCLEDGRFDGPHPTPDPAVRALDPDGRR